MPSINETNLEKTFSDLAYANLRDKTSALLAYLVGFQMLKQEKDGARAVGIFAFEIDGDFYYVPVFFLNGEIRGMDSVYSLKQDMFVPLDEDWQNSLIGKRAARLGEADLRGKTEFGSQVPNYTRQKIVPAGGVSTLKLAAAQVETWAAPKQIDTIDLPTGLRALGLVSMFKAAMERHPEMYDAVMQYYTPMDFYDKQPIVKKAAETAPVVIVTGIDDEGVEKLTDTQRETILGGGYAVMDKRSPEQRSQVYSTQVEQHFQNPTSSGLYDVIYADGDVQQTLVLNAYPDGTVFVYRVKDGAHGRIDASSILTIRQADEKLFYDALKKAGIPATSVTPNSVGSFVLANGVATPVYCVDSVTRGIDDIVRATVRDTYYMGSGPCHEIGLYNNLVGGQRSIGQPSMPAHNALSTVSMLRTAPMQIKEVLLRDIPGTDIRYHATTAVIPAKGGVFLEVNRFSESVEDRNALCSSEEYTKAKAKILLKKEDFGSYITVSEAFSKTASELKVWRQGRDYMWAYDGQTYGDVKVGAFKAFITKIGMEQADAEAVLEKASSHKTTWWVKKGAQFLDLEDDSFSDQQGGEMSPFHRTSVPWGAVVRGSPTANREVYEYNSPYSGGDGAADNDGISTVQSVVSAAQTGEKETFDAAALSSLVKTHAPTDMAERFLPTMTAGMDRLGRLLFLIHWHYDNFENKYGERELGDFIDNLRSTYQSLGESILFIKKTTLAGDSDALGLNLQPATQEIADA